MDAPSPESGVHPPVTGADVAAAGGIAAAAASFVLSPAAVQDGPVVCPFRRVTGLPCPGCGLTRSWVDLAHGDVAGAWSMNPFGFVLLAGLAVLVVVVVRSRRRREAPPTLETLIRRPAVLAVAAVWVTYGVVRAAGGWA